jgi:uncharacterized protein involved in exopolysaccharide biosynthesis
MRLGGVEEAKKTKPFRPVDALWRRLPMIMGVGAPCFLLFLLILAPTISPIYKVTGSILIKQEKQARLNGSDVDSISGDISIYQRTLALRIVDPKILKAALESVSADNRPTFLEKAGNGERAVALLSRHLTATEVDRTYLVNIDLTGNKPKGLANMLNTILRTLLDELQREQKEQYSQRLEYLQSEKTKISNLISEERQRVVDLAAHYKDTSFLRPAYTADLTKLDLLQGKYLEAESEALSKEALYKASQADQEKLSKVSVIPFAEEKAIDNLGISEIESYNYQQAQSLRATVDGLTADNADRKNVEGRIEAMKGFLATFKDNYRNATVKTLAEKQNIELDTEVIKAQHAYEGARAMADTLRDQYKAAKDEVTQTSEGVFEANDVTLNLAQLRDRLSIISARLDDEELQAKSPLPVVLDQEAITPENPTSSNAKKILMLAFFGSFGMVAGVCMAFDFFDQRIRCREELGASVGGLGAEPIPATIHQGEDPSFTSLKSLRASSRVSGPLRDLALRLILEHERGGAKIISFVGIHRRSGNTSIALNIARAISGHGFDVLLAELPTPHPGLANAAELPPRTKVPHSPWGNKEQDPHSAVELIPWTLGTPKDQVRMTLDPFLANATKVYDFVLLDLVALDTTDIARETAVKSDVVVITGAQDVANYGDACRTVNWIVAGGVPAVTTVLNFTKPDTFRLRIFQFFGLIQRSSSQWHTKFRDWGRSKEADVLAKLSKSANYKKMVDCMKRSIPPEETSSSENKNS